MGWKWLAAAIAVILTVGSTAMPAHAQAADAADSAELLDLYDRALGVLVEEIGRLVVLERFETPVPDSFEQVPALLGIASLPDERLTTELEIIDNVDGPRVLAELHGRGLVVGGAVEDALWTNVPRWDPIDPHLYVVAYDELLANWWLVGGAELGLDASPIPGWDPAWDPETVNDWIAPDPDLDLEPPNLSSEPDPTATGSELNQATEDDVSDSALSSDLNLADAGPMVATSPDLVAVPDTGIPAAASTSAIPWIWASIALAALFAISGLLMSLRRRASRTASARGTYITGETRSDQPNLDAVLEAGRRLLTAKSVDELGESFVSHANQLCDATGALFACGEGTWTTGVPPTLSRDLATQVRSTGRTVIDGGAAIVPVVAAGRVVGIIAVADPANGAGPIEQLAPLAGEGLASVVQQSATEELAFVDGLTSVHNRRRFDLDLPRRSQEAATSRTQVAVAMIDVDHFKTYNDTNGHPEGDEALRVIARLISENLRAGDAVYRYGGEEFAVLLPGADIETARAVVERVRCSIEAHSFRGGPAQPGGRVTISVGVAAAPPPDGEAMLEAADAALLKAKTQGRNQVMLANTSG